MKLQQAILPTQMSSKWSVNSHTKRKKMFTIYIFIYIFLYNFIHICCHMVHIQEQDQNIIINSMTSEVMNNKTDSVPGVKNLSLSLRETVNRFGWILIVCGLKLHPKKQLNKNKISYINLWKHQPENNRLFYSAFGKGPFGCTSNI